MHNGRMPTGRGGGNSGRTGQPGRGRGYWNGPRAPAPARHTAAAADLVRLWNAVAKGDLDTVKEVFSEHPLPGDLSAAASRPAATAAGSKSLLVKGSLLSICVKKLQHLLQKLPLDRTCAAISVDQV